MVLPTTTNGTTSIKVSNFSVYVVGDPCIQLSHIELSIFYESSSKYPS